MKNKNNLFGEKRFLISEKDIFIKNEKFFEKKNIFFTSFEGSGGLEGDSDKSADKDKDKQKNQIKKSTEEQLNEIKLQQKIKTGFKGLNEDLQDDINKNSFYKTFAKLASENGGIENLYKKLQSLKPEKTLQQKTVDKILNGTSDDDFGFEEDEKTYSDIRSFFKDAGYQPKNNWLYEQEGQAIFQLVEVFVKNKDILASQEEKDEGVIDTKTGEIKDFNKFENYLFDFDRGADIKSDKIEGMSESEIKNFTTKENFPNLIANLELGDSKEFAKNLMKDPTLKTQFHERLKLVLGTLHTPEPLFIKNGDSKFFKEYLKLENNFEKEITKKLSKEIIIKNLERRYPENVKGIIEKIGEDKWDRIIEQIQLNGAAFALGVVQGAGITVNIEEITKGFLDNINIGIVNIPGLGIIPAIGVSKNILDVNITKDGKTKLSSIAGANAITPSFFINLGIKHDTTEDLKEIFQQNKSDNFVDNFRLSGNINYINIFGVAGITSVSINVSEIDEESFVGAEKMVEQMGPIMDIILEEIEKGTSAEKLDTSKIIGKEKLSQEEISTIKGQYNVIKETFEGLTKGLTEDEKSIVAKKFKRSALSQYANNLHKNNEGLNFTGVGAGVAFIAGFLPLPYIMATGEYNYQTIKKVKDTLADQASKNIQIAERNKENLRPVWNELGMDIVKYKGKQVLLISKNLEGVNIFSDEDSKIQMEKDGNGNIYLSSGKKSGLKLHIKKNIDNDSRSYEIIFGEEKNANQENIANEIISSLSKKEVKRISNQIKMSDAISEFKGETKILIQNISNVMDKGALQVEGVKGLMDTIGDFQLGEKNIDETWAKMNNVIFGNGGKMGTYLKGQLKLSSFGELKKMFKKPFEGKITNEEKIQRKTIILESLFSNVMKDKRLDGKSLVSDKEKSEFKNKNFDEYEKYKNFSEEDKNQWQNLIAKNPDKNYPKIPIKYYDSIIQPGQTESRSESFAKNLSEHLNIEKNIIDTQNQKFYNLDGTEKPSFNVNYYTKGDIIAFPAPSGNEKIVPRTGIIEFADMNGNGNFEEGKDFLKMNNKISDEMAEKIPDEVLKKFLEKLETGNFLQKGEKKLDFIRQLITGKEEIDGVKFNYDMIFFKWGKCFNTAAGIKGLEMKTDKDIEVASGNVLNITESVKGEIYGVVNKSIGLSGVLTGKLEEKKKDEPVDKPGPKDDDNGGNTIPTTNINQPSVETQTDNINQDNQNVLDQNPGSTINTINPPTNQASQPGTGTNGSGNTFNNNDQSTNNPFG